MRIGSCTGVKHEEADFVMPGEFGSYIEAPDFASPIQGQQST